MILIARDKPIFEPGQLVRHRHYGYRGVVVAVDYECRADEAWYQRNRTQPDRNQPWYHVFVDGTDTVTYAAQENLSADTKGDEISHPALDAYFCGFADGGYVRNTKPWFGW